MYPLQPPGAGLSEASLGQIIRRPDILAHFWNNPAEISGHESGWRAPVLLLVLSRFQGGADYPAQIWNNPAEISAPKSEWRASCLLLVLSRFQGGGADYPAQIWNNPAKISAHISEWRASCLLLVLSRFQGGRIIRPRFGIIRPKYSPIYLSDAHLAFFWSLAVFRGGRIIRPRFGKIRPKYPAYFLHKTSVKISRCCQLTHKTREG
jgi:hypothetical protein